MVDEVSTWVDRVSTLVDEVSTMVNESALAVRPVRRLQVFLYRNKRVRMN